MPGGAGAPGARAARAAEASLWSAVRGSPGLTVVTGGQTGVDTEAALAALGASLSVHLVFPKAFRQEDGPLLSERRSRLTGAQFHELASASFRYRTWTVVYLGDAVILLDPAGGAGCRETARAAVKLGRPLLDFGAEPVDTDEAAAWLRANDVQVLTVAGCRASVLARTAVGGGGRVAAESLARQISAVVTAARARDAVVARAAAVGPSTAGDRPWRVRRRSCGDE